MAKILVLANNSSDAISGNILDVLETLDGVKGYKGDVTILDAVTLDELTKLNKATTGAITLKLAVDFVASSTEILTAIAGDIKFDGSDSVTITNNNYTLAQLNTISDAGVQTIVLSNTSVALSGSATELEVLYDIANYAGTITVTGKPSLDDLKDIAEYTTGAIKLANTSVELSGTAADLAAMLPTLAGYKGAVTVSNTITLAELKAINNATTGAITLVTQSGALSGSAADILAAFKGIKSYKGAVEVTGTDYKLADLKAINAITEGNLTVTTSTVALTGTAKDLVAALDGVTTYAGKVTVTGSYTVDDLKDINTAVDGDVVLANKKVALTGKITDITAALTGITDYAGDIKLTDVPADTAALVAIAAKTKGKITLPTNAHTDLEGTAAELQPVLAKINGAYKGDVTVTTLHADSVKALAQLKAINNATSGDVSVTTPSALEGSIKDIQAALNGNTVFAAAVTVTDTKYTLAQLKTIADSGVTSIDLDVNAPLSGSVADLTAVLAKVTGAYAGDITVTGKYTLAELATLNGENGVGTIKVANTSVALSGDADDLVTGLSALKGYKGAVTVNDAVDLDQLLAINNATTGAITLAVPTAALSGSAADILAAFKGIKSYEGNIEVTGTDYKLADLKAINAITEGDLTIASPIALTGTAKDLVAALKGVDDYNEDVTVTGSYTVADLESLDDEIGTGSIILANKNVALTGEFDDIEDALSNVTGYTGAIKLTDSSISEANLKILNGLTTGKITLPANGHPALSGTVLGVTDALQGITGYKGTVTVTVDGTTTLAQLKTITNSTVNKAVLNTSNLATLEGTAKDITAVLNKFSTEYIGDLTVTGSYTLADLVALDKLLPTDNGADVTLVNNVNLSGKSADIAAALSNVTGYAGKITLSDKPTLDQLVKINAATTEAIKIPTDTALTGTAAEILQALNGVEGHKGNITVTPAAAAADVNTIAGLTTGVVRATITTGAVKATLDAIAKVDANDIITFVTNDTSVDASDLVALRAKVDNLTTPNLLTITEAAANIGTSAATIKAALAIAPNKAVIIDGNISAADLDSIANATNGAVTATISSASNVAETLAAITNVNAFDTITYTTTQATVDASDLVALKAKVDTFNTGSVTKITETAVSVASVDDALDILGADTQTTAVEITGAIAAGDLNTIANNTAGVVTATLAADTDITDAIVGTTLAAVAGTDAVSLTSTELTADATALVALAGKVATADVTAFASVTTITEAGADVTAAGANVVAALNIVGNDVAVEVTGGISAADADKIADATSGVVTAAVAGTASVLNAALLDATVGQTVVNAYTLTLSAGTVAATDLTGLDAKTSVAVDAASVGSIDGSSAEVVAAYTAYTAGTISGLGNETVGITGTDATVANVAAINTATSGIVTVAEVDVTGATFSLAGITGLGDLAGITGLETIDATNATATTAITITAADLFAANDSLADITLTINADATDTLTLAGWAKGLKAQSGYDLYSTTGNFDGVAGDEIYTVKVTADTSVLGAI